MPRVELNAITHHFGDTLALDNATVAFVDDVTTAIVGRSGSGKSTLLQCINGLVRPGRGGVRVFDAPIDFSGLPALRRRIGYAVQGTGLFPHMTVAENIGLLARLSGWSRDEMDARIALLMALVELPDGYATRYPHMLSGGEQQRVGLCRAMVLDPPVFLLDEPFGALDPITKSDIHAEFERLQRAAPRTIIMVTHDLREAVRLAERLIMIDAGRIVQHDDTQTVIENPTSDVVADLVRGQLS